MNENRDNHQALAKYLDQFRRVLLRLEMAYNNEDQQAYGRVRQTLTDMLDDLPNNIENTISTRRKEWLGL
jgi:hypothetical protein